MRSVEPQLHVTYCGKVSGKLGDNNGIILSNHDPSQDDNIVRSSVAALDSVILKSLIDSLGDPKDIFLLNCLDLKSYRISIISPDHPEYRPVYFNRRSEYGKGHTYYEALCHALPHRKVIKSSSARYFNPSTGKSLMTGHLPSTIPITALIEAVRDINTDFFDYLSQVLTNFTQTYPPEDSQPEDMVKDFLDGAFRNIAIQIHYNGSSYERLMLYHMDHVFSALHMAVTLNGRRIVGFSKARNNFSDFAEISLEMQPGDVYVTTPAGIMHGVSMDELSVDDRSVALQCRTLLGEKAAQYWSQRVGPLCVEIGKVLAQHPLKLPTFTEWDNQRKKLEAALEIPEDKVFIFEQQEIEGED